MIIAISGCLRPATPAASIAVAATFPANLHAGNAVNFDVTAALVNGATGTLTVTVDQLPDGLTLGSTTNNGDGTFTATVSGTLTTEQAVTSSFSATGGSVAATPLTHEFDVQAHVPVAMALSGTIPNGSTSGPVDAHLTLGGDFTAPVAITGLPAWLSASVSGTDVRVTGTYPSTADIYDFTVTATDSSATPQVATRNQSIVVSEVAASAAFVGANVFTSASGNAPLPAGCLEGDWLLIVPQTNVAVTLASPSSAIEVVPDTDYSQGSVSRHFSAWGYRLTATDISNGYVAINGNAGRSQLIVVRSSQASSPLDVAATSVATTVTAPSPMPMTASSLTTVTDGALLIYLGIPNENQTAPGSSTPPTGFTTIQDLNNGSYHGTSAYMQQTTAGATGDVTGYWNTTGRWTWGAALIAIKP